MVGSSITRPIFLGHKNRMNGWCIVSFALTLILSIPVHGMESEKAKEWTREKIRKKCEGQPRKQIREWFGTPDDIQLDGEIWGYRNMRIADPDSGKTFTILIVVFTGDTGGKVKKVRFTGTE